MNFDTEHADDELCVCVVSIIGGGAEKLRYRSDVAAANVEPAAVRRDLNVILWNVFALCEQPHADWHSLTCGQSQLDNLCQCQDHYTATGLFFAPYALPG